MKNRPVRYKNKILVALVALFTMLMCVSIGFASWVTSGATTSQSANGNIGADDYVETTGGDAYCIANLSINTFGYAQGYGFVDQSTGRYVSSTTLTGSFDFDVSEARDSIDSIGGSRQFSLKLEFTTSATSGFTYSNATFTGFTNSPVSKSASGTATLVAAYNITLTTSEYAQDTISCGFSITMAYGNALSGFPSLSSATYSLVITPGEVIA